MTRQFWFWVIFVIAFLFDFGVRFSRLGGYGLVDANSLLFFVLVGLLGWQVYGPAIKG